MTRTIERLDSKNPVSIKINTCIRLYGNYEATQIQVLLPVPSHVRAEESWRKWLFSRVSKKVMDINESERRCQWPRANPPPQINHWCSPVCQASPWGREHKTSDAACHPVRPLSLHHLTPTRQDLGSEGPLCTQSSPPVQHTSRAVSMARGLHSRMALPSASRRAL